MIGERIKQRRKHLGMSQDELAALLGYDSRATISKIESGIIDMSVSKVEEFAKALKTSSSYLMGWEDEQEEPEVLERFPDDIVILARGAKTLTKDQIDLVRNLIDNMNKQNED